MSHRATFHTQSRRRELRPPFPMSRCSVPAMAKVFAALVIAVVTASAPAAPPNDECSLPTRISRAGSWNLDDLLTATLSVSPPPIPATSRDVWFCWTPSWSGVATLDVGAASLLFADVYLGCACPPASTAPILSVAALTGVPSGNFDVECNQRYLIRVAAELYPFPLPPNVPVRTFSLARVSGKDCPLPADGECADCCGGKPTYEDPLWTSSYMSLRLAVFLSPYLGMYGLWTSMAVHHTPWWAGRNSLA